MKQSGKNLTRLLALMLIFAAVFTFTEIRPAAALESEPVLYRYSGGEGTYKVGDVIKVVYKYSPCYREEYTYCEMYNSEDKKVGTTKHKWTNENGDQYTYKAWDVNIDTTKLGLTPGVYYLKSYVRYYDSHTYQYLTTSIEYSTFYLKSGATIELNKEKYTYTVSYLKTTVPKKTLKLTAEVEGSESAVTWSSSDKSVATVSSTGKVTMKALGTCTITATVDGASASCKITVKKQTGTAYYKKYIKPVYEEVLDCVDEPYKNIEDMRENCDAALEAAQELKAEINKVKVLKKNSQVKKHISAMMTNVRKADKRAWMTGIDIDDAQMIQYRKTILDYIQKLDAQVRKLLKK